jgi:hypothetical protein
MIETGQYLIQQQEIQMRCQRAVHLETLLPFPVLPGCRLKGSAPPIRES